MIALCKKWGRYGLVCPIVFMSKEMRRCIYEYLIIGWDYLVVDKKWVWLVAVILFGLLVYFRSAELYTYSMEEELQYMGRLPIIWERQKKLYIPDRLLQKSSTGRYVLKMTYSMRRVGQVIVYARHVRLTMEVRKIMHFQMLSEGKSAII
ncbi:MAG: hypothetical protein IKL06_00715 [Lachnospiraceae bacterium]|nr:hypothetical protein [Lachnospiraceae bacterium]